MGANTEMDLRTLAWAITAVLACAEAAGVDIEAVIDTIRAKAK
jgi:hypothetical protein